MEEWELTNEDEVHKQLHTRDLDPVVLSLKPFEFFMIHFVRAWVRFGCGSRHGFGIQPCLNYEKC